jgi:hypothetical protein
MRPPPVKVVALPIQLTEGMTQAEINAVCNQESKRQAEALTKSEGPEGIAEREAAWQELLRKRAKCVVAAEPTNVKAGSSCVRGARAYLPTRR